MHMIWILLGRVEFPGGHGARSAERGVSRGKTIRVPISLPETQPTVHADVPLSHLVVCDHPKMLPGRRSPTPHQVIPRVVPALIGGVLARRGVLHSQPPLFAHALPLLNFFTFNPLNSLNPYFQPFIYLHTAFRHLRRGKVLLSPVPPSSRNRKYSEHPLTRLVHYFIDMVSPGHLLSIAKILHCTPR